MLARRGLSGLSVATASTSSDMHRPATAAATALASRPFASAGFRKRRPHEVTLEQRLRRLVFGGQQYNAIAMKIKIHRYIYNPLYIMAGISTASVCGLFVFAFFVSNRKGSARLLAHYTTKETEREDLIRLIKAARARGELPPSEVNGFEE